MYLSVKTARLGRIALVWKVKQVRKARQDLDEDKWKDQQHCFFVGNRWYSHIDFGDDPEVDKYGMLKLPSP